MGLGGASSEAQASAGSPTAFGRGDDVTQNWQSEFLAVGSLIVLDIILRQHGSSQSRPVTATHIHASE